jgi:4-cresol dehydrogenase (hydroxylating)
VSQKLENTLGKHKNISDYFEAKSANEVKEILIQLKDRGIKYSVNSVGHNWGYGCSSPPENDMAVINLSKMNKIIEFDNYHGVITIEPGVTYGQMANFLEERGGKWITPVHGGGPECSAMGNALERGYGLTPNMDHFGAVNSIEAILEDGSDYKSSLSEIGQEKLDKIFKYGVGPYLDGIFTQSNIGIVTKMTIRLARKPEYLEMFYFNIKNESDLEAAIEATKDLKVRLGDILGGVNFINKERALSMVIDYPLDKIKSGMPLSIDEIGIGGKQNLLTPWLIVGALYGEKSIVKQSKKILKKRFKKIPKRSLYYNSTNRGFLLKLADIFPNLGKFEFKKVLKKLDSAYEILEGKPSNLALNLAYWKNEDKEKIVNHALNPTKDNCGLIWYAPLVELSPKSARDYVNFINSASEKFKINSIITLTTLDDLCFDSTIPILFNKNSPKDKENAWAYYNYLLEEGAKLGFYPYRLNIESKKSIKFRQVKI